MLTLITHLKEDFCERLNFILFYYFLSMLSTWILFVEINMRMRQILTLHFIWSYLLFSFIMDISFCFGCDNMINAVIKF